MIKIFWSIIITAITGCIFSPVLYAQSAGPAKFQKIDEENGLSDNNVTCIFKGKYGFIWVGTSNGLNLLDGSDITNFENIPGDINSISNNDIKCITQDSSGYLWIGTNKGLDKLDVRLRKFSVISLSNDKATADNSIISIAIVKNNNLYVATASGLYFFDQKNKKSSILDLPGTGYNKVLNNKISQLRADNKGVLWISTFNGLWSYNEKTHSFNHEISNRNDNEFAGLYTCMAFDHSGNIWLGTWNKGLKRFNPETGLVSTFSDNGKNSPILDVAEISGTNGGYGILINSGLVTFDPTQNRFSRLYDEELQPSKFYYSSNGLLWLGTRNGLYYFKTNQNRFNSLFYPHSITGQGITMTEWNGRLLVGANGEYFLKMYSDNLKEITDYSRGLPFKSIDCLSMQLSDGKTIKCGTSEGIAEINLINHHVFFHYLKDSGSFGGQLNFITHLLKDSKGDWWIFPWRNGIWKAVSSTGDPKKIFSNFLFVKGVPKQLVIADAREDKNGNIWMADYDEGIILYNRKRNHFSKPFADKLGGYANCTQILYYQNRCYSYSANVVLSWNVDSTILHILRLPPLSNKTIQSIAIDSTGHLWIATRSGLVVYNQKEETFRRFTTADGLPDNKMNGTLYCLHTGTMVFGCANYLISFDPSALLKSIDKTPSIQVSEVLINGKSYSFDLNRKQNFNHNTHRFLFKWAVTDFNDPLKNRYSYKLLGIDNDWRYAGTTGRVEFANLSSGNYTLLLRGENSNGVSASNILKLNFSIDSPFWKTWWFFSLLICAIGLLFYEMYHYRLNQIRKMASLRNRISRNLHDDIGSTLSSISILSAIALNREEDKETQDLLAEIKDNSIAMMEKMDDIVWSINPKNDTLQNLFLRVRTFAARLFEARGIRYKIDFGENMNDVRMNMEDRQHLYLIMKEAINNLVKYSECTKAEMSASFASSVLSVKIRDDGKGFDTNISPSGNGLLNMRRRAKILGAILKIESKPRQGTSINLELKIR